MPSITIKSADVIAKKWTSRASAAGADYTAGIQNPRRPQAQTAAAAANSWAAGVQQAVTNGTYSKNVLASADKYLRNSVGKGSQRYPGGITAGSSDFQNGIGPYLDVLANLNLPPRAPKGDPSNIQRVAVIATALRAKKLSK
jgi:hypothetical protein